MDAPFLDSIAADAPLRLPALPGADLPWLDALRREALAAFLHDGFPSTRDEMWKYTALRALEQRRYAMPDADAGRYAIDVDAQALSEAPRLVFVNGVFRADLSVLDALPEGVELRPLSEALRTDPEPLRFALAADAGTRADAFTRLNRAFFADGMVLRVAAGICVTAPLHVVHVGAPAGASLAWHARHVIEVGEGASLTLLEEHRAAGTHAHLGTLVGDVALHGHARLDWVVLQDAAVDSLLVRRNVLRIDTEAMARMHVLETGAALARHELRAELRGDGARLESRGAFLPQGRQHIDTWLDIRHVARDTASDAQWRGIADQRGRGVFHGLVVVDPGADGADANLGNKNLLLSPHAEIDTRPVLEINADEVKAAHGATVGQLDDRALFYLRSRGLPLEQARRILTLAFCRGVFDSIRDEGLRQRAYAALAARHDVA